MITCSAHRLDELFLLGGFQPAAVQREYQWTTKECGQLLEDLFEAFVRAGFDPPAPSSAPVDAQPPEEDHEPLPPKAAPTEPLTRQPRRAVRKQTYPKDYFLGPMVLLPAPRTPNKFYVYDGLQRFTTLSILLAVLRDSFSSGDIERWFDLQQLLRTEDGVSRLQAPTAGGSLATIVGALGGSRSPGRARATLAEADLRMRDAAQLFHERTGAWSDARRIAFVKFLREHAHVAVTTVDDRSMAYKIFVTANDRGLSLKLGDIIKGRLVEIASAARGVGAGEQVSQKWSQLQRALRPRFDDFLRAVDFMEFGVHRPSEVGEALLERFEGEEAAGEVTAWVSEELPAQSDRFLTLFKYERMDPMEGIHVSLRQLDFLQDTSWRPVAMALQWAFGADYPTWALSLRKLVRACYLLELLDWPSKRRAEETFAPALAQLSNNDDPFKFRVSTGAFGALHFPPDLRDRARSALVSPFTDAARRGAIVHWLETLYFPRGVPQAPVHRTTIEHVLPRAAKGAWTTLFPEDIRDSATHKLGNLCLVPKEMNYDLGNSQFPEKRARYLELSEEFKSAREIAAVAEWNPVALHARTQAIAAKAAKALWIEEKKPR